MADDDDAANTAAVAVIPPTGYPTTLYTGKMFKKQDFETDRAFMAFAIYRDLGMVDRSLDAVAQRMGIAKSTVARWSRENHWLDRVQPYDSEAILRNRRARVEKRRRTVTRHDDVASKLLDNAERLLAPRPYTVKGREVKDKQGNPIMVMPSATDVEKAANALDKAIKAQRLSQGLPTEHTRTDVVMRETLNRTLQTQEVLREIIEIHLCPACRAKIGATLQRMAAESADLLQGVDDDAV